MRNGKARFGALFCCDEGALSSLRHRAIFPRMRLFLRISFLGIAISTLVPTAQSPARLPSGGDGIAARRGFP
jgi:hypothetical protein